MKDWAQTFWCCGASDGKSLNSPVVPRLERNSARSTAQLRTVWPQGAALEEVFTSTAKLWLVYVIREKLWKLLKWTVSFGWKKINLRLTVSKDFNGSMLVEKIIAHRKGPFKLRKWTKNKNLWSGSGLAGINRRDYGTLVGIVRLKNPIGDP